MAQALLALFLLGVLVTFHELGHFLAGRLMGVYIHEFAIGFGPVIYSRMKDETRYTIRAIPVGGFNRFAGEEGPDRDEDLDIPKERLIGNLSPGRRAFVIVAGPVFNLLVAALAFFLVFSFVGIQTPTTRIIEVLPAYPAESAGMRAGDIVTAIAGSPVRTWEDLAMLVQGRAGQPTEITVQRNGEVLELSLVPIEMDGVGVIGVRPDFELLRVGFFQGIAAGFAETYYVSVAWITGIIGMLIGKVTPEVTGPIGITQILGEAARTGLAQLFYIVGILSANLALFNLMPFPALDGSRLIFYGIEAIRGKPIDPEKEGMVHFLGFFLLMALFVFITFKDIVRLVR